MPSYIVKPVRERDFYIEYSTIVDTWSAAGRRADLLDYGIKPERLDRADKTGTSSFDGFYSYANREKHGEELMFREQGDQCDTFHVPYDQIEAMLTEQERESIDFQSAAEQALYEKYGKKWEPED